MDFVERYAAAMEPVLRGYVRENKRYATIAVGCTGGKHRSVAIVETLARRFAVPGVAVTAMHRDLGRERHRRTLLPGQGDAMLGAFSSLTWVVTDCGAKR